MKRLIVMCCWLAAAAWSAVAAPVESSLLSAKSAQTGPSLKIQWARLQEQISATKARGEEPDAETLARYYELTEQVRPSREDRRGIDQGGESCSGATVIPSLPYSDTGILGINNNCAGLPYFDIFYVFTATEAGQFVFDMCGSAGDTYIRIWLDGTCCMGSYLLDDDTCGDLDPRVAVEMTEGQTIYIECGSRFNQGRTAYNFNGTPPQPPPPPVVDGEDCEHAIPLTVPGTVTGNSCEFLDDYDPPSEAPCPYGSLFSPDVVYSYTPPANQFVTFYMCNSGYDTWILIWEDACETTPIACNDDACSDPDGHPFRSRLDCVPLFAGHTYYILVDGFFGACGNYTLETVVCGVPECPPEAVQENEPCSNYPDLIDGGCNYQPPTFIPVDCGGQVCGTANTFVIGDGDYRDTDWYTVDVEMESELSWCVIADFDVLIAILSGDCPPNVIQILTGSALDSVCASAFVEPGTYHLFVAPSTFSGVPCSDYHAWVSCRCLCQADEEAFCHYGPDPIPDDGLIVVPIYVYGDPVAELPEGSVISDLDVCVDITHEYDDDLDIRLRSPNGTNVTLSSDNGGSGDNYTCTIFDDEAEETIRHGEPPFNGRYRPEDDLEWFDWESPFGEWRLRVRDDEEEDVGTLNWVCLHFEVEHQDDSRVAMPDPQALTINNVETPAGQAFMLQWTIDGGDALPVGFDVYHVPSGGSDEPTEPVASLQWESEHGNPAILIGTSPAAGGYAQDRYAVKATRQLPLSIAEVVFDPEVETEVIDVPHPGLGQSATVSFTVEWGDNADEATHSVMTNHDSQQPSAAAWKGKTHIWSFQRLNPEQTYAPPQHWTLEPWISETTLRYVHTWYDASGTAVTSVRRDLHLLPPQ